MQQISENLLRTLKNDRIPEEVVCQSLTLILAARAKVPNPLKQIRKLIYEIMYDGRRMQELGR